MDQVPTAPILALLDRVAGVTFSLGLVLVLAGIGSLPAGSLATPHEIRPGEVRWPIKTSVPAQADLTHPKAIEFLSLAKLGDPPDVHKKDARCQGARKHTAV